MENQSLRLALFSLIVSTLLSNVSSQLEGETCRTSDGISATCQKLQDCDSALENIARKRPDICGFDGFEPIVCCEPNDRPVQTSPTTNRSPSENSYVKLTVPAQSESISQQKCREYASHVHQVPDDFGTSEDDYYDEERKKTENTCGIKEVTFISGNSAPASPREFPHQAAIGYQWGSRIINGCGGVLISENFVLTAAHCSNTAYGRPRWVTVGDLDLNSKFDNADPQEIRISNIINHPAYRTEKPYNDIALYQLQDEVKFNGYARPACLNIEKDIKQVSAIVSGWGDTSNKTSGSSILLKTRIDLIKQSKCSQFWPQGGSLRVGIDERMICAGDLKGMNDTCGGDSGGPLQNGLSEPYCMYTIIGVTSFGPRACGSQVPAIYTRVSHYVPWIESIVWP